MAGCRKGFARMSPTARFHFTSLHFNALHNKVRRERRGESEEERVEFRCGIQRSPDVLRNNVLNLIPLISYFQHRRGRITNRNVNFISFHKIVYH